MFTRQIREYTRHWLAGEWLSGALPLRHEPREDNDDDDSETREIISLPHFVECLKKQSTFY